MGWHDLGLDILENASHTLLHYYYMPELRAGQEGNIAALRDSARELAKLLGTHPAFMNDFARSPLPISINFHTPWHSNMEARFSWVVMQAWGGYWYATPEEGVQNYRELLEGGYFPRVRRFLLQPDFTEQTGVNTLDHGSRTTGQDLNPNPFPTWRAGPGRRGGGRRRCGTGLLMNCVAQPIGRCGWKGCICEARRR